MKMKTSPGSVIPPKALWIGLATLLVGIGTAILLAPWGSPSLAQTRKAALKPAPIDGERAYRYLKAICEIGPRPAGSAANARQRAMVDAHFRSQGGAVREQTFTARDPQSGKSVEMANLIGSWSADRKDRIVIGAHYDTRPFPDAETDPARKQGVFIGANDGASGVALLMEIAHHLKDLPTPYGIDLVLLDGEELVYDRVGDYFLGSKEFARRYRADGGGKPGKPRYIAGVILDMVGDRNLDIEKEPYSVRFARNVVEEIWGVAAGLKARGFKNRPGAEVLDDHLALNEAGIPTADLIDFNYPRWHTVDDLPEACSPASLTEVGRVVTAWLALPPKARRRP